jgi:hypothetical protein
MERGSKSPKARGLGQTAVLPAQLEERGEGAVIYTLM